jgi:hypothetical protein
LAQISLSDLKVLLIKEKRYLFHFIKNNIMKKRYFLTIILGIILLSNCTNKLETFPNDSLGREDFSSLQGIKLLSTGIYSNLI